MKNFLSDHAKIRLKERSRITEEALLRLLDRQLSVTVGGMPSSCRLYRLIYSTPDAAHLVVVHDMVMSGVVTILHHDCEGGRIWRVSKKELKRAKRLASALPGSCLANPPASSRLHIVVIWISSGFQSVVVECGSHFFAEKPRDTEDALGHPGFMEKLLNRMRKNKVPVEAVEEILLTDCDRHIVLRLPWHVLENFREDTTDQT
jgi:hypothetical protein